MVGLGGILSRPVWGSAGSEAGGGGAVQVEAPAHGPGLCWAPVAARPPHPGMLGKRLLPPSEEHGRGRPGPQVAEQTCTDCPGSGPATTGTMAQGSLPRCRRWVLGASQDGPSQRDSVLGCVPAWGPVRPGGHGLAPVLWEPRLSTLSVAGRGLDGCSGLPQCPRSGWHHGGPPLAGQLPFQPLKRVRPSRTLRVQRVGCRGPDAHPGPTAHSHRGNRSPEGGLTQPALRLSPERARPHQDWTGPPVCPWPAPGPVVQVGVCGLSLSRLSSR